MKHLFFAVTLISMVFISSPVTANAVDEKTSPLLAVTDVLIYRPVGLVVTIVGSALFVAFSPFTALAQISPPHNAFEQMYSILMVAPAAYTFSRPVGQLSPTSH